MDLHGVYSIQLESIENAICMEDTDTSKNRTVKVFIPKLMNSKENSKPTKNIYYMNKNQLLNSSDTLPKNIKYNVSISNYIELQLSNKSYINTIIKKDTQLLVLVPNKNIKNMVVIEI